MRKGQSVSQGILLANDIATRFFGPSLTPAVTVRFVAALLLCFTTICPLLPAQGQRGIILGRVVDPTGAVIPDAQVKVIQTTTNVARSTQTNSSGNYEVPGLFPGDYNVEATMKGFRKAVVQNVTLDGGQRAEINLKMEVGEAQQSVTVKAEVAMLDTASADVNTVVSRKLLDDLPIGQGHATYVFLDAPGLSQASSHGIGATNAPGSDITPYQRYGTSTVRYNGAPAATTEYAIDGAPNTQTGNAAAGGGTAFNPNTDVVEQVRVQTNTFDASIGHTSGATVDLSLRAGTNTFHGVAFGDIREPGWSANLWASKKAGLAKADYAQRRWGLSGGGPVWLGPIYKGKDKTFFYYGFEKWSKLTGFPYTGTVPRPQHLSGDFSDLLAIGPSYQFYDPATGRLTPDGKIARDPFPRNVIPSNRINPTAKAFSKLWPAPTSNGTPEGRLNITYLPSDQPQKYWNSTTRIDHNLSASHKLFGRLLIGTTFLPYGYFYNRSDLSMQDLTARNRDVAVNDVWTISPTFIADFRVSVMRFLWEGTPKGVNVPYQDIGFQALTGLFDTKKAGFPSASIAGYNHLEGQGTTGFGNTTASYNFNDIRSGAAHFTKVLADHSLKFGTEVRYYIYNTGTEDSLGMDFAGGFTRGPFNTSPLAPHGGALADFLLGAYSSAAIYQRQRPSNLSTYWSFYFNDDWKVTSRLQLNVGLRYEREGPATERFNQTISDFAFDVDNPIAADARANYSKSPIPEISPAQFQVKGGLVFAGVNAPRTFYDTDKNNFAPRIGAAYRVNDKTSFRAGYGIFYVPYGQRFFASTGGTPGFAVNTNSYSTLDGGLTISNTMDNIFPKGLDKRTGSSQGLKTFLGQGVSIAGLRRQLPSAYNQRWQASIQRVFGGVHKLEIRYVGNRTIKMPFSKNIDVVPNQYLSTSPERDQATIDRLAERFPNPFLGIPGMGGSLGTSTVLSRTSFLVPYPHFGGLSLNTNQGYATYNALQVEFSRRVATGLTFQTSYSFSKTIDGLGYLNAGDPVPERVISGDDRPHAWRFSGIWELPFGKNRLLGANVRGPAGHLISGWQMQGITYIESGAPQPWGNVLFRGNIKDIPVAQQTPDRMFNTEAGFEKQPALQLASNVRTFPSRLSGVRTSTGTNTDISLLKDTYIFRERVRFRFKAEAYNIFNQHFFPYAVNTTPSSSAFGTTVQATGSRTVQFVLRIMF